MSQYSVVSTVDCEAAQQHTPVDYVIRTGTTTGIQRRYGELDACMSVRRTIPLGDFGADKRAKIVARRRRFLPHNENFDGFYVWHMYTFWLSTSTSISLLSSLFYFY